MQNRLKGCIVWNDTIKYSLERLAIRAQASRSFTYLRLSNVSVICRVTYFQFPIQSAFQYINRQSAPALRRIDFNTQYRTSDVAANLGRYLTCAERTAQCKIFN